MKKIDLGQAVTLLANLGVIAGIVFLAIELRQNNNQLAAQSRFNYFQTRIELSEATVTNPTVARITAKRLFGEDLTPEEQFMAFAWGITIVTGWRYEFGEYMEGNLTLDELDLPAKRIVYASPAWAISEVIQRWPLSDNFSEFLDEQIVRPCAIQPSDCQTPEPPIYE